MFHSTDSGIRREISSESPLDGGPGHTNPTLCEKSPELILCHRTMISRGELVNTSHPFFVTTDVSLNAVPYCPMRRRALAAWAFGWGPAQEASGTTWMPPYLAELLNDPYDAVRYVAHRSLRTLPGYAGFEYDYVAGRRERVAAALPVLESWRDGPLPRRRREPALLVDLDGRWRVDDLRRILRQRDDRPLFLRE